MAVTDLTHEFRVLVKQKRDTIPDAKRRKLSKQARRPEGASEVLKGNEYVKEAYIVLNHITTLTRMLSSIRKPYLSIDSRSTPFTPSPRNVNIDMTQSQTSDWSNIRHLTNEERDQIDLQARMVLKRCADRVKEMEELEKRRTQLESHKNSPLSIFLPSRLLPSATFATLASDVIAAHHASITWYLSRRLAEASQSQKEMQEERVKRQLERTKTLGSGAAREAASLGLGAAGGSWYGQEPGLGGSGGEGGGSWLGTTLAQGLAATIGAPDPSASTSTLKPPQPSKPPSPALTTVSSAFPDSDFASDSELETELTQSQIQQFEAENAQLLQSVQSTLAQVQQAEARLGEIAQLQNELIVRLGTQSEQVEKLYEDAMVSTGMVERGNEQLKEARRRAKDSRLFVLVFLIGASFSLLFLHYY